MPNRWIPIKRCLYAVVLVTYLVPHNAISRDASGKTEPQLFDVTPENTAMETQSACSAFLLVRDKEAVSTCEELRSAAIAGSWDTAKQLAATLERRCPNNGIGYWWMGQVQLRLGKHLSAVRDFIAAVERSPEIPLAHWSSGLSYGSIEQYRLFVEEMSWLVRNTPNDNLPHYYLGRYYWQELHDTEKGREYFQEALKRNPSDFRSCYYLGYGFELEGKLQSAKQEYEGAASSVASKKMSYSWPLQGLARVYLQEGNLPVALRYAQEATSLDPKLAANHLVAGKVFNAMGAISKAIEELSLAAKLDASDATPHYLLLGAYRALKMPDEAEKEHLLFQQIKATYGDD
jgi:tetratricopeptide (TPR) repeat protein